MEEAFRGPVLVMNMPKGKIVLADTGNVRYAFLAKRIQK